MGPSLPPCRGLGLLPTWEGGREVWGAVTGDIGKGSPWRGGGGRGGGGRPTVRCLYERAVRTTCRERQTERDRGQERVSLPHPCPKASPTPRAGPGCPSCLWPGCTFSQAGLASSCHMTPTSTGHAHQGACPPQPASAKHTPRTACPPLKPRHRPHHKALRPADREQEGASGEEKVQGEP